MASERQCSNCEYFIGNETASTGGCRRFPPTRGRSSTTLKKEWCGEFKEKGIVQ